MPAATPRFPESALVKACQDIFASCQCFTVSLISADVLTGPMHQADHALRWCGRNPGFRVHVQTIMGLPFPLNYIHVPFSFWSGSDRAGTIPPSARTHPLNEL